MYIELLPCMRKPGTRRIPRPTRPRGPGTRRRRRDVVFDNMISLRIISIDIYTYIYIERERDRERETNQAEGAEGAEGTEEAEAAEPEDE